MNDKNKESEEAYELTGENAQFMNMLGYMSIASILVMCGLVLCL